MQTRLYEVYVQDQKGLRSIGAGWRSLFARPGRKWVAVLDWTTLTTCHVSAAVWDSMKAKEVGTKDGYLSKCLLSSILAKLSWAGREPTKFEQDCIEACTW